VKSLLEVHTLRNDEPIAWGILELGLQEDYGQFTLNLFGDTNTVHIRLTPKG
jgi:arginine decarboxylase